MMKFVSKNGKYQTRGQDTSAPKQEKGKTAKYRSPEKALYTSLLSMVLCCVLLLGTTFAWYTASVSAPVTPIQTGKFQVALVDDKGKALGTDGAELKFVSYQRNGANEATQISENDTVHWEPGDTFTLQNFKVDNQGDIDLTYAIILDLSGAKVTGNNGEVQADALLQMLTFGASLGDKTLELQEVKDPDAQEKVTKYILPEGTLSKDDTSGAYTITVTLAENANNTIQGLKLEGIKVTVQAIQASSGIKGDFTLVSSTDELTEAVKNGGEIVLTNNITLESQLTIEKDKTVTLNLNGFTLEGSGSGKVTDAAIVNNGNLTITGGTITNSVDLIKNSGTLTILDGVFSCTGSSGAAVRNYGICIIQGGTFAPGSNSSSVLTCESGKITVESAVVNTSYACMLVRGGTITVEGGTFTGTVGAEGAGTIVSKVEFTTDQIINTCEMTEDTASDTWTVAVKPTTNNS